ncbi:unnamed protein product [Leuciscus chuanchicus]
MAVPDGRRTVYGDQSPLRFNLSLANQAGGTLNASFLLLVFLTIPKMSKQQSKSHKAMDDTEWVSRLRSFASTGVWPSDAGNRPAPRQKKWYSLYQKIDKCPLQLRGQRTLFSQPQRCLCGFHSHKLPTTAPVERPTADTTPASLVKRPKLTLSSTHSTTATNAAARVCEAPVLAGGPPQTISPPQPPSAESFFLAPPLPPPKQRHWPVEGQSLGVNVSAFQLEHSTAVPLLWPKTMPQEDH